MSKVLDNSNSLLREELERLKKKTAALKSTLEQRERVQQLCKYLINGETGGGFFSSPTYAFFVRQYRAEPSKFAGYTDQLVEVDLVIIPDLLEKHVLRVDIPDPTRPGTTINIPVEVDVAGIVERTQKHARNAKNVSVGTYKDVLSEACNGCVEGMSRSLLLLFLRFAGVRSRSPVFLI